MAGVDLVQGQPRLSVVRGGAHHRVLLHVRRHRFSGEARRDAADARWSPVGSVLDDRRRLAFDHHRILTDGVSVAM